MHHFHHDRPNQALDMATPASRYTPFPAPVSISIWLVTFMDYDLGYFDDETCRLEPIDNSFGPKLFPMSPE